MTETVHRTAMAERGAKVAALRAKGLSNLVIAERLGLTPETVRRIVARKGSAKMARRVPK